MGSGYVPGGVGYPRGASFPRRGAGMGNTLLSALRREAELEQRRSIEWFGPRMTSADFLSAGHPEAGIGGAGVLGDSLALAKAPQEEALPSTNLTLEELVSRHLAARRESYIDRAWQSFRQAGEYRDPEAEEPAPTYQDAQRLFNLADTAAIEVTEEKPAIKLAIVYTGIAAGQYAEAINALKWFLKNGWDPASQAFKPSYVHALRQMRDFGRFYGERSDYDRQNAAIEDYDSRSVKALSSAKAELAAAGNAATSEAQQAVVNAQAAAAAARALLVLVDWGRQSLTNANTHAGEVAGLATGLPLPPGWLELPTLLRQAMEPVEEPAETPRPGLPLLPGVADGGASSVPPQGNQP